MQPYRPFAAEFTPSHTPQSPSYEKETHIGDDAAARQAREAADGVLRDYEENQAR
jgi:mitofusin